GIGLRIGIGIGGLGAAGGRACAVPSGAGGQSAGELVGTGQRRAHVLRRQFARAEFVDVVGLALGVGGSAEDQPVGLPHGRRRIRVGGVYAARAHHPRGYRSGRRGVGVRGRTTTPWWAGTHRVPGADQSTVDPYQAVGSTTTLPSTARSSSCATASPARDSG